MTETTDDLDLTSGVEAARRPVLPGPLCGVGTILADATLPLRAATMRTLLATETPSTVQRQLAAKGVVISYETVKRHMRGECACRRRGVS